MILSGENTHSASDIVVANKSQEIMIAETGYWLYGFEQSFFITCDNNHYWMWKPAGFTGSYSKHGTKNPVKIKGLVTKPDPKSNMGSTLPSIIIETIQHVATAC
ncbi:MAG: hypothetical protein KJO69_00465 [Gammaproteobacteria bacterium]|nr:hypothetical protein [Gammaproteobacteria bacterium]